MTHLSCAPSCRTITASLDMSHPQWPSFHCPLAMGDDSINALVEVLKKLSPQAPTTLVPPSFDWSLKDQYDDFQLFIKSVNSWFTLQEFQRKLRAQPMLRLKTPFAWTTFSTSSEIKDGRGMNVGNPLVNTQMLRSRRQVHSWPTYSRWWTTRSPSDARSTSWKKLGFYLENHWTN